MLPLLSRLCRRSSRCLIRVGSPVWLFTLVGPTDHQLFAQRPPAMTSFRHSKTIKALPTLDWIGIYEQLPPYSQWWKETAACAGIPLPDSRPDSVEFFYVNAVDFAPTPTDKPNRMVAAVTYASREQVFVSILRARDEKSIKHEMMHQILYWWGEEDWDDDARLEFKRCKLEILS